MTKVTKQAVAAHRRRLKTELWLLRSRNVAGAYGPICPYCGRVIRQPDSCVMHEWLIRRAALPVKLQLKIMHKYNCVLVHFACHDEYETTMQFRLYSARAQFERYGRDAIVAWVEGLSLKQAIWIPTEEECEWK